MTEIRYEEQAPVRKRNPWLRPALTAAAVATVAAVTFTLLPSSGGAPSVTSSGTLLEDVALAAEHDNAGDKVRDDQFAYVDTKTSYAKRTADGKGTVIVPLHRLESWVSVDASADGLIRDAADPREIHPPALGPGHYFAGDSSSYNHLKSLPADPDAMYDWLEQAAKKGARFQFVASKGAYVKGPQAMFLLAGDLIDEAMVPPEQSAALYRAAARIPGVTVVEDAVDALGRHGVGVARQDDGSPVRVEWIFDEKTYEFLGERTTVTKDYAGVKKGTVVADTAIVNRDFVDKAGQRP